MNRRRPPCRSGTPKLLEHLNVPLAVLAALRVAGEKTPPTFEFGGRLVVRDRDVLRFEQGANWVLEPRRFACLPFPAPPHDCREIHIHSHPSPMFHPSDPDIEVALAKGWDVTAIYSVPLSSLAVWAIARDGSYEAVPIRREHHGCRRPPLHRPGRRS